MGLAALGPCNLAWSAPVHICLCNPGSAGTLVKAAASGAGPAET